jgi:hypothetical protein
MHADRLSVNTTLFPDSEMPDILSYVTPADRLAPPPLVNAHIHLPPNFSAFDTVEQAVELAAEQAVRVIGVSNYYDYQVYADFTAQARRRGVFPLFGLEIIALLDDLVQAGIKINDPGNPGKMYICGKGIARFDPMTAQAQELLQAIRDLDSARMAEVITRLEEVFRAAGLPTGLDEEAIKAGIVRRHGCAMQTVYLQERHVAQAFQEAIFAQVAPEKRAAALTRLLGTAPKCDPRDAPGVQNEIRTHLMKAGKPAYVTETFVGFEHAYRLILALGGIPCYPTLADGAAPICPFEEPVERLITQIRDRGIYCAEFIPIRNSPEILGRYVRTMRRAGLAVTAGTEHNTRDLIPLRPTCARGQAISEDLEAIFWEGACVAAAHQYLVWQGKTGFVDDRGRPNPAFGSDEERILAFARLGEAVISRSLRAGG